MTNNDTALLDSCERILDDQLKITLARNWLAREGGWKVTFKQQFERTDGSSFYVAGGGATLRAALSNAITELVINRLES